MLYVLLCLYGILNKTERFHHNLLKIKLLDCDIYLFIHLHETPNVCMITKE